MAAKCMATHYKNDTDELIEMSVLIERLKRLRALNREPENIGLTQYRWRSFSIDKARHR
ncbi:MAG: hypothetical protein ISS26_00810 [Candidatus Omnitrophica bacterium]|nr:hypothetical protein [Candidatus Omnitrophota bacterium]